MKKSIMATVLVLVLAISLLLTGCGSTGSSNSNAEPNEQPNEPSSAAQQAPTDNTSSKSYPEKEILVMVPYKAGGGVDKVARLVSSYLEKDLGVPFVVVNKPEGNGIIALSDLAKKTPDGYNLCVVSNRDLANHIVSKTEGVDYDVDSFEYLGYLLETGDVLFVKDGSEIDTIEKLRAKAMENPGKITIATANNTGEKTINRFGKETGTKLTAIVYGSGATAFADLLGGHVDGAMVAASFVAQAEEQGFKAIGITNETRLPALNHVPTFKEQGVNIVSPMTRLLIGPKGLPEDIIKLFDETLTKIYKGEIADKITEMGDSPVHKNSKEALDFFKGYVEDNR